MFTLSHVKKSFGDNPVLRDVSIKVNDGDVVAVLGPSGSGKTTLLRAASYLTRADGGTVELDGEIFPLNKISRRDLLRYRRKTGFVFQNFNLFANKTVLQNVTAGLTIARKMPRDEAEAIAIDALKRVGMLDRKDYYVLLIAQHVIRASADYHTRACLSHAPYYIELYQKQFIVERQIGYLRRAHGHRERRLKHCVKEHIRCFFVCLFEYFLAYSALLSRHCDKLPVVARYIQLARNGLAYFTSAAAKLTTYCNNLSAHSYTTLLFCLECIQGVRFGCAPRPYRLQIHPLARVCLKNSLIRNFGVFCAISASSTLDLALLSLRVSSLN